MTLLVLFTDQVAPVAAQSVPTVQALLETTPGTMVDVSADWEMFSTVRGRNRELDVFQAGTAMLQLLDTARKYDPSNTAGPYAGQLKPMRALQLTATWNGTTYPLFTGTVDSIESVYDGPANGNATTTFYATDGLKALAAADLASSAYAQEVLADSPSHWYRLGGADTDTKLQDELGGRDMKLYGPFKTVTGLVSRDDDGARQSTNFAQGGITNYAYNAAAISAGSLEIVFSSPDPAGGGGIGGATILAIVNQTVSTGLVLRTLGHPAWSAEAVMITTTGASLDLVAPATSDGAPHHIVATLDGSTLSLYVDGALVAAAPYTGDLIAAGAGSYIVLGGPGEGPVPSTGTIGTFDEAAWYSSALSAARVAAHAAQVSTPWDGDLPGARLGRVLDAAGWPAESRDLDTGTSTLQSAELGESALDHAQKVAASDFGVLFVTADGRVRFIGRAGLFNQAELVTFGDGGGAELGYVSLRPELTDQLIRNDVTVSRVEGIAQNARDATSIATYLRHSYTADGLLHDSDDVSRSAAEFLVSEFKEPRRRISNMVVRPRGDPAGLFPWVLGLDLQDQITVKDRPPGGGAPNSQDTSIEGITHTATPLGWETAWNLAPSFGSQGTPGNVWALGLTGFSELGQTTRLGF